MADKPLSSKVEEIVSEVYNRFFIEFDCALYDINIGISDDQDPIARIRISPCSAFDYEIEFIAVAIELAHSQNPAIGTIISTRDEDIGHDFLRRNIIDAFSAIINNFKIGDNTPIYISTETTDRQFITVDTKKHTSVKHSGKYDI